MKLNQAGVQRSIIIILLVAILSILISDRAYGLTHDTKVSGVYIGNFGGDVEGWSALLSEIPKEDLKGLTRLSVYPEHRRYFNPVIRKWVIADAPSGSIRVFCNPDKDVLLHELAHIKTLNEDPKIYYQDAINERYFNERSTEFDNTVKVISKHKETFK